MLTPYWKEIQVAAAANGLDPLLVEAMVLQESAGNTDAFRFERNFWNRYLKPKKLYVGQNPRRVSSSYGLMQIMYPTACERGFKGQPENLFLPDVGLEWGCKQLAHLVNWAAGYPVSKDLQLLAVLASYNGGTGGNTPGTALRTVAYAKSVMGYLAQTTKDHA